jgi:oligopeptide transport system permease protein
MSVRILLKKGVILLVSLFVVASLTFFIMHAVPGDPFTEDRAIPEEIMQALYKHYGLDQPWYVQYGRYLKGILSCDLGPSFKYQGRSVTEIIAEAFPVSLTLGLEALCIALLCGVTLGSVAALHASHWQDTASLALAVLGISVPSFVLATALQYVLAMKLNLLPVARWGSLAQSVMPALSLAALPTAYIMRLMRSAMIETLSQDYIQTARAKGLHTAQIVWRHLLRNSLLPVASYLGPLAASVFTGSFVVEKIFGIPGLGQWFVLSVTNRDYTLIMGVTLFYSALLMLAVFLTDLLCALLDPRIKKSDHV